MISFYILSKRLDLKRKGLPDARVLSLTKKEYGFCSTFFVNIRIKSVSYEWLNAICWSFRSSVIFLIKKCVELSLTSFGTAKNDCVIKTGDQFFFFFFCY